MPQSRRLSPGARKRRRAARRRLVLLSGAVVVLLIILIVVAAGGSSKTLAPRQKSTTTATTPRPKRHVAIDPVKTAAVSHWITSRHGTHVSVAVLDLKTGKEWLLHPAARDQTASIIKADILETLLYQTEQAGQPLSSIETDVPQQMIEASDNDDATDLWNDIGAAGGLAAYNQKAGLTQTVPNTTGFWGITTTSAADQIKVLEQLAKPSHLLTKAAQDYELDLMQNIDPGEGWGVSGGVPKGVSVSLKNGWVPLTSNSNWEVNSIGWIKGKGHNYLLAVLTEHDPSENYGIKTIHNIAADVYAALGTQGLKTDPLTGASVKSRASTKTSTKPASA